MDVREKLIELIMDATNGCARYWASLIADKLLSEGVLLPPYEFVGIKQTGNVTSVKTYSIPDIEAKTAARVFDELDNITVSANSALIYYDKWFAEYNRIKKKYKEGAQNEP